MMEQAVLKARFSRDKKSISVIVYFSRNRDSFREATGVQVLKEHLGKDMYVRASHPDYKTLNLHIRKKLDEVNEAIARLKKKDTIEHFSPYFPPTHPYFHPDISILQIGHKKLSQFSSNRISQNLLTW